MAHTILVVDDDEDIRAIARQGLATRGYVALETGDPHEAIRIAKEQRIDLLLTDVIMPIMKGTELADRVETSDVVGSGRHFMAKPFSIDDLARRVRDTLDRPSSFARSPKAPPASL